MRHQQNSTQYPNNGADQLAALTTMRALLPRFTNCSFRKGSFVMMLTDLHQSNIIVDDDWNITHLIEFEWTCVRPVGMVFNPPRWAL
ncbi:hypothetical protein C7999DRAFT_27385 [Corynascus novoguineensis]|uniref:Aminoglycoside phosphotransferase domain-containing protein n=1 Tax=Corynascus novoguineensis TaxID=1126955 RepID=A0AAN7D1Q0_9PEZI|nr:hypothetical protein C7999DRAFT_27385 [Corynascus novoguineensis]